MSRPYCLAIINDSNKAPHVLGKSKLKECRKPLTKLDEYTMVCPDGHRKRTSSWENRTFAVFYGLKTNGSLKV